MRLNALALALAFVAAAGTTALADSMMKASPKPSPSAMHANSMMKSNHMHATPKPSPKATKRP